MISNKLHWSSIAVCVFVLVIFCFSLITFTVSENEHVLISKLGKIKQNDYKAGFHWKMPSPIESVIRLDKSTLHYEGKLRQMTLKSSQSIMVKPFCLWKITNPREFYISVQNKQKFEENLNNILGTSYANVLSSYKQQDIFNNNLQNNKLGLIKQEILEESKNKVAKYGVEIVDIGFQNLEFSPSNTNQVLERMKVSIEKESQSYINEGQEKAAKIINEGERERSQILSKANSKAAEIKSEAEKKLADIVSEVKNQQMAKYIISLLSLEASLANNTVMIVDPSMPPYDVLNPEFFKSLEKIDGK